MALEIVKQQASELAALSPGQLADELARRWLASGFTLHEAQEAFTHALVLAALEANRDNQCRAAERLGVHRNTLGRVLVQAGITKRQRSALRRLGNRRSMR